MSRSLVFISGASSGIGLALARAVPWSPARVLNISRRKADGLEHFAADLADPASWRAVADLFAHELDGFDGERAVFVHSAGTLDPIGFAGEVEDGAYTRNVLLNSAAPQVLGHAFLRALGSTRAPGALVMISSGAARSVYPGWSSYGAGKAAVDQWVRTAGAEQRRRNGRCRVVSLAPGVVATAMQDGIREMRERDFPELARFVDLHRTGSLRDPDAVAREIWALLEKDLDNGSVLDLRELSG